MPGRKSFHEKELLGWLRNRNANRRESPIIDIGDDAALVALDQTELLLTVDCLVEGVHFEYPRVSPRMAGRKAVMRAVSDIAAMAGRPRWVLAALCIPEGTDSAFVKMFCEGMMAACRKLNAELTGGDVSMTAGPMTAVVTIAGEPGPGGAITRSGARVGDAVCVTGTLGGSILGRHLRFMPRVDEALELCRRFHPHAMIDISDGLSVDAAHLAEESGVRLTLESRAIPVSRAARRMSRTDGKSPLWHAMNDGEDYELLWCISPDEADELLADGLAGTGVTRIGTVTDGQGIFMSAPDGRTEPVEPEGWEHEF